MGAKWDFDSFAPSIHMGPVWENQDAPTSSWMPSTWVLYRKTKMYPNLPECFQHQSHVGEPSCTDIYPNATPIGPMWNFYMGPKWDFDTFAPSIHMGPEWENPEIPTNTWVPTTSALRGGTQMHP